MTALAKFYTADPMIALWAIDVVAVLIIAAIGFILWSASHNRRE